MTNLSKKRKILIMVGVMLGLLLASLDSTVVNTAMPKIIGSLNGFNLYTWPVIAYLLCMTIAMPLFGKLADIYGYKPVYVFGIVIFLTGSALCGLSQNMLQLAFFRGLQGIGGAILISNTLAIIGVLFAPAERAKYGGFISSAGAIASIIGPLLGGFITDNLSWRWVFYVNVPIGIIALVIIMFALPAHKEAHERRKIDYPGAAVLIVALIPMMLAFTLGGKDYAWNSIQIIGTFTFSLIMLIVFALIERKASDPIIPLSFFRNSVFNFSVIEMFLLSAVMMGSSILIPLFLQGVTGTSASKSGAITSPMTLSFILGTSISGIIISKTKKYKIQAIIGFAIMCIGTVLLSFLGVKASSFQVVLDMIVLGSGMGIVMPIFIVVVQSAFSEKQIGVVTSCVQFFRFVGSTIASAIFGTILSNSMNNGLNSLDVSKLPVNVTGILKNPNILSNAEALNGIKAKIPTTILPAFKKLLEQVKQVLSNSIHQVFVISIIIAAVALFTVLFMKEIPLNNNSSKDSSVS